MLAAQGRRDHGGWQPDRRASLGLALAGAALLGLSFVALLYRPAGGTSPTSFTLSVLKPPEAQKPAPRSRPSLSVPVLSTPVPLAPLPPIPGTLFLQEQVDQVVRESAAGNVNGPFLAPARPDDPLTQALQASEKPSTLGKGESYRSSYGDTIVKSGGGCTSMQQVQVGPTAKAGVGFMVPCPGEYRPTMTDALSEWASKRAAQNTPPG